MTANLYEQDYHLWLKKTAELLQAGRLAEVDIPNLLEEIEDMGKSVRRATRNNLIVVLMHLLKYAYQLERRSDSWLDSIVEPRRRIDLALEDSPSLKPYLEECSRTVIARLVKMQHARPNCQSIFSQKHRLLALKKL